MCVIVYSFWVFHILNNNFDRKKIWMIWLVRVASAKLSLSHSIMFSRHNILFQWIDCLLLLITRSFFIRFWQSTTSKWSAHRDKSNGPKPPPKCWYMAWSSSPTQSSKYCFKNFSGANPSNCHAFLEVIYRNKLCIARFNLQLIDWIRLSYQIPRF